MMRTNKRLKGFTLTELIVVLAIIGVLAAILAPTMINYYRSSRVKDANADAKMVLNAAQTEVQKYISVDRVADTDAQSIFSGKVIISCDNDGNLLYSGSGIETGLIAPAADTTAAVNCADVAAKVHAVVSDGENVNWAVYIDNYVVKACVATENVNSRYIGMISAEKADGTKTTATEMSDITYSEFMVNGSALKAIADEFYDNVAVEEETE